MYQWLITAILAAGLSGYNIYQAINTDETLYFIVAGFWMFAAIKQYKKFKNSKNNA